MRIRQGICIGALLLVMLGPVMAAPIRADLGNGMRVAIAPSTASQVVSIEVFIAVSALDEPLQMLGLRNVLLRAMLQGSTQRGGDVLRRELSQAGGELEGRIHGDMLEFRVTVPADQLAVGLHALGEIIVRPRLGDDGVVTALMQAHQQLAVAPSGALEYADFLSKMLLYQEHPYVTDSQGIPATVNRITPDAVRAMYQRAVTPANTVLVIAGRVIPADARQAVLATFGEWAPGPSVQHPEVPAPRVAASQLELRQAPVHTTCVMLTFPACAADHADAMPLLVTDAILSGGTASRLFREVRERQGLAYAVASHCYLQQSCGRFTAYALTQDGRLEETKTALVDEIGKLQVAPVSAEELERAKGYLKARYLLSHQYSAQQAYDIAWSIMVGNRLEDDAAVAAAIDTVTAADVQRVARYYLTRYYLVVVMPEFRARE